MGKQTPKMSAKVVNAIRNLREAHGSTSKEIMNYIMSQSNSTESTVHRQMQAALKRGLEYGILMKKHGHYFLNTETEPQFTSTREPVERSRKRRRRGRSRRRGRRRSRGKRRRSRRSGRRRRSRTRRRSRSMRSRQMARSKCKCTGKSREVNALRNSPVVQQVPEDDVCTCEKEDNLQQRRNRQSKSRDRSMSRSRSSGNSDHDGAMDDRHSNRDQD